MCTRIIADNRYRKIPRRPYIMVSILVPTIYAALTTYLAYIGMKAAPDTYVMTIAAFDASWCEYRWQVF